MKPNRLPVIKLTVLLLAAVLTLSVAFTAVSCVSDDNGNGTATDTLPSLPVASDTVTDPSGDTETVPDETADNGTDADVTGTDEADTGDSEAETAIPRHDYFTDDVSANVTIDAAVYTDMALTLPTSLQITDKDVTDYIDSLRFNYRVQESEEDDVHVTDKPLRFGDSAFIYYRGLIDGKEFEGGSNMDDAEPVELGIGSQSMIPGFESSLIGLIPEQTSRENPATIHVTFPENYAAEVAGQDATFEIYVVYAVRYAVPEYNRSFVEQTLGYQGSESFYAGDKVFLAEFEKYVRDYLEDEASTNVEYAKSDALWTYLTDAVECKNIDQDEIKYYYDSYVSEIQYYYDYYSYYYGDGFTSIYPELGPFAAWYLNLKADADWQSELMHTATLMVEKDMITHAIAEAEGLESVTDAEYQAALDFWVEQYSGYMTEEDIIAAMGELYLREYAFSLKMSDWLMSRVTFTYAD